MPLTHWTMKTARNSRLCIRGSAKRKRRFDASLKRNARAWGQQQSRTIEFLYRRRYNLTVTDSRFLETTYEDIVLDHYAHYYADNPNAALEESVSDSFEEDIAEFEREAAESEWETVADDKFGSD
jgi:hypothetical protein